MNVRERERERERYRLAIRRNPCLALTEYWPIIVLNVSVVLAIISIILLMMIMVVVVVLAGTLEFKVARLWEW